jgi:hypothetical protein
VKAEPIAVDAVCDIAEFADQSKGGGGFGDHLSGVLIDPVNGVVVATDARQLMIVPLPNGESPHDRMIVSQDCLRSAVASGFVPEDVKSDDTKKFPRRYTAVIPPCEGKSTVTLDLKRLRKILRYFAKHAVKDQADIQRVTLHVTGRESAIVLTAQVRDEGNAKAVLMPLSAGSRK